MKIGSHVANKGPLMLAASAKEAISYKANCLMVYLGAPQNSYRKDLSQFKIELMHSILKENDINLEDIIVHAPYIVNLAQPDETKRQYAIDFITREVKLTHGIGAKYIVIHPGAHVGQGLEIGLKLIADSFTKIIEDTKETEVVLLIETMAGKGTECCFRFEQINEVLNEVNSNRVAVCLDTCHINDAGYDIVNNYEKVIKEFDEIIGLDKLKVIHLNDSKNIRGTKKDRHENIGYGTIGFYTLSKIAHDNRFSNIPKILETPYVDHDKDSLPPYKYEIEMLRDNHFDENLLDKIKRGE